MHDLLKEADQLLSSIEVAMTKLNIKGAQEELSQLRNSAEDPEFWGKNLEAQENLKQQSKLEAKINPWVELYKNAKDTHDLIKTGDKSLKLDLEKQLEQVQLIFGNLKSDLKLNGIYDDHDAILGIYAGAGGTDAQDWAQMLMRMYLRWAESHKFASKIIDQAAGDEAGIKSATIELSGEYAYGKLKSEHGVHRLVRLSPFNSDNLRQTSFAKVDVLPKVDKPAGVDIDEKDLKTDVYRSGGHGGQSVNTTDSAVRITHVPTGITVAIQNERSQLQNKETALTILRSRLARLKQEQHSETISQLKGPNQSAEWGNQIRNYVLHPYKQVKDLRTNYETSDPESVLDGKLDPLIDAYLEHSL